MQLQCTVTKGERGEGLWGGGAKEEEEGVSLHELQNASAASFFIYSNFSFSPGRGFSFFSGEGSKKKRLQVTKGMR